MNTVPADILRVIMSFVDAKPLAVKSDWANIRCTCKLWLFVSVFAIEKHFILRCRITMCKIRTLSIKDLSVVVNHPTHLTIPRKALGQKKLPDDSLTIIDMKNGYVFVAKSAITQFLTKTNTVKITEESESCDITRVLNQSLDTFRLQISLFLSGFKKKNSAVGHIDVVSVYKNVPQTTRILLF